VSTSDTIKAAAAAIMPEVVGDLAHLVSHASVSFPGYPAEPVLAAANATVELLHRYGIPSARLLDLFEGYPVVLAEIPAPPGAPTVLMYGHYDVQPAPAEQGWLTDPWTLTKGDDGRLYGRGAADNKSSAVIHAGALRVLGGAENLPVGVKIVLEGEEETLSHLEAFVEENPELFAADLMMVADMGNLVAGEPVLTTTLRGDVHCIVTIRTIEHALHSGIFGGAAPDALVTLVRLLATLHDEKGNTAVPGLVGFDWEGTGVSADLYREQSGMIPGVELVGDGSLASRLWSRPSVTVIGLDAPRTADAANILIPSATAHLSMRIAPGQDPKAALDALVQWLESHVPWGARIEIQRLHEAPPFTAATHGPGVCAARTAMTTAYGVEPGEVGSGGSIPLLNTLSRVSPGAEFVLWGAEDVAHSRIHGANESVDPAEIERLIVAEAITLLSLGGE
jgi:acetylornithine deacetylase/succinyl-diaminopimelate desuccinylase-like protein